jgi:CHASE3 domain sensor protein
MPTRLAATLSRLTLGKRKLPLKVLLLVVIALVLSLVLAATLSFNLSRMRESFDWVRHTNEVLRQLSAAERRLLEAESAERGYLLSGDRDYLESFNRAEAEIPAAFSMLQQHTSDNSAQLVRVNQLRKNVDARLDELRRAIEFGSARLAEAMAILAKARARQLTPEIERNVADIRQAELVLLEERQRNADASVRSSTISAAALSIFFVLGVAVGAFLLERQSAMSGLRAANENLERSARRI